MHSVAQRQELPPLMDFPHHAHHGGHGHGPRRHNTTTALDTSSIDSMSHPSHMRVNSLSSKGSLSDYPLLRTPQDTVQSDNDALIVKSQDDPASAWKPSVGMVQEQLTSSPIEEHFGARARAGSAASGKPMSMHINTSFTQRSRAVPFSAHPNQKLPATSQLPAPQSATAAFPPMPLPNATNNNNNANATNNNTRPSLPRPVEAKLPDLPPSHNAATSQHRRTQSAPLLSLSPIAPISSAPQDIPNPLTPPLNTAYPSNSVPRSTSYSQIDTSASLQQNAYPMAQVAAANTFSPFPAMNPFPTSMPGVPPQVGSPLMWPQFFPQPTNFYNPPRPQAVSPSAGANMYNQAQPSITTQWKINPNSQPQMPLSHLINQAQGMLMGGPSAHNRKIGLYKTEICRNWEEKQSCRYGVKCQFAHGPADIRTVPRHPKYKTEICRTFWVTGSCPYGKRCCFIHPTTSQTGAPLAGAPGVGIPPGPLSPMTPYPMNGMSNGSGADDDTAHTISLLARLDLKRSSPDGVNGARHTPDSNASTDPSGFVYPGMNGGGPHMGDERSASGARV